MRIRACGSRLLSALCGVGLCLTGYAEGLDEFGGGFGLVHGVEVQAGRAVVE